MALWFTRSSKNLAQLLKLNLGLLRTSTQCSRSLSSLHHYDLSTPTTGHGTATSSVSLNSRSSFSFKRFESSKTEKQLHLQDVEEKNQVLDFPGGPVTFTPQLKFISESSKNWIPCYRVLDDNGKIIVDSNFRQIGKEIVLKMYRDMVTLQVMDTIFYEAQRQGRISFYLTSSGEEAISIASAAALSTEDLIFPQYREPGILLWRGFTIQEFANQLFTNKLDYGKGRQMPIHYGSKKLNYMTVSSPIGTQLPQAVGAAYSLKMDKKNACAVTYFGDGATSEGDFHAALNFAAVMEAPVIFICRNNGWAISTPTSEQFRSIVPYCALLFFHCRLFQIYSDSLCFLGDGIVVKGQAYGIRSIRVDGNDFLAVYSAIQAAREMAVTEHRPILVEAHSYRVGHHSTSDDSTKYRSRDEIDHWRMGQNPVTRCRKWIEDNGWWTDKEESELRSNVRKNVQQAIQIAEKLEKPPVSDMFTDVYDSSPSNLREQEKLLRQTVEKHQLEYPPDVPV